MFPPLKQWISIQVKINADNPALLDGLESWLELGLISQEQVKKLCQHYLTEPLPPPPQNAQAKQSPKPQVTARRSPKSVNVITKLLQSLKAELSVRWLLFLGLFMVVMSSGILAASQWERFPSFGQYGILLAYTLAFWVGSQWTKKQSNLTMTAETLRQVTLLLIPLNFWAMDDLELWINPWGWVTITIAALVLTATTINLYYTPPKIKTIQLANLLLLSYLNWGWSWSNFPMVAIYLGVIITTAICLYSNSQKINNKPLANDITILIYGLIILLGRGIFIAQVDIQALGLAVGICGWLIYLFSPLFIRGIGYGILFFGWLISVTSYPEQAFIVSGLGIAIFTGHLLRFWRKQDLLAIFAIGLQMVWLVGPMIPSGVRQTAIITGTEITNSQSSPWSLLSLTWFPYLIFMVWVTDWLYRSEKPKLGLFGEKIALGFGIFLALLGGTNPIMRSLNLIASTLTLGVVIKRRIYNPFRVYLTHITGLLAVVSTINWLIPGLTYTQWGIVLLFLMLADFALFIASYNNLILPYDTPNHTWGKSGFYLGLVLAGCSYLLFLNSLEPANLSWLMTPLALTALVKYGQSSPQQNANAGQLAILTTVVAQYLTVDIPVIRIISLGIGTVIIIINSYYIQNLIITAIAIGFCLIFLTSILWELQTVSVLGWLLFNAIALGSLWIFWYSLGQRKTELEQLYAKAADHWGMVLCGTQLIVMTFHSILVFQGEIEPSLMAVSIMVLTVAAIGFRARVDISKTWDLELALYGGCWGIQLLLAEIFGFLSNSLILLAIANTILGIITQIGGDWWQKKHPNLTLPQSLQVIPLLYGILGTVLRFNHIAIWTSFNVLGLAIILIGIGRRQESFKPLVYLGIGGISAATLEMLFYQVSSQPLANQLVAFAALATSFVYLYRILLLTLARYLNLGTEEIKAIAHLHWLIGSVLLGISCFIPGNPSPLLGLGTGILLTRYGVVQGRHNPNQQQGNLWVYLGLLEAVALSYYIINVLSWGNILFPWIGAIISLIAYFFYISPWEIWGWSQTPWQRAAIILPISCTIVNSGFITYSQLSSWYIATVITAIFYVVIAELSQNIRLTYPSIILINWVIIKAILYSELNPDLLWIITPPALSLLYLVQVEPSLQGYHRKPTRHLIRIVSISAISLVSLLESQWVGLLPGLISLTAILAGLTLKTRAFLYIGTATFMINIVNQLIILNSVYSFLKWIVVFIGGLIVIWGAANFENRRDQMVSLFHNSMEQLDKWE